MTNTYFKNVETLEELRKQYKELLKIHHPDNGGDVADMQEINSEYDKLFKLLKDKHESKSAESSDKSDYNNMKSLSALFRYNIMNLFHKWAGSIYNSKTFLFDLFINAFFHSVRPDNDRTLTDHIQIFFRT